MMLSRKDTLKLIIANILTLILCFTFGSGWFFITVGITNSLCAVVMSIILIQDVTKK